MSAPRIILSPTKSRPEPSGAVRNRPDAARSHPDASRAPSGRRLDQSLRCGATFCNL